MRPQDVIAPWDQAGPIATHPSRGVSEDAYWESGREQAAILARDMPSGPAGYCCWTGQQTWSRWKARSTPT